MVTDSHSSRGAGDDIDLATSVACTCLDDYQELARRCLPHGAWAYLAGGGADEYTVRWNREAFAALRLHGRVLTDMSGAHTRLTLFEQPFDYPILLAPVAHESAGSMVAEAERAILDWTDGPIRDDLCLLVLRPR